MDSIDTEELLEYCETNSNIIWVEDDKKNIKSNLCFMMLLAPNSQIKTINNALEIHQIPYIMENVETSRDGKNVRGIRIIRKPSIRKTIAAESDNNEESSNKKTKTRSKKTVAKKEEQMDTNLQKMINFVQNEIINSIVTSQMLKDMKSLNNKDYTYEVIWNSFSNCKEKIVKASWNMTFESSYHKFKYFLGIVKNDLSDNLENYKLRIEEDKRYYEEMFNGWAQRIVEGDASFEYYREVQGAAVDKETLEKYVCEI